MVIQNLKSKHLSFEFFPPSSDQAKKDFFALLPDFEALHPDFVTLTCGAMGGATQKSYEIILKMLEQTQLPIAPHMTCTSLYSERLIDLAKFYWGKGIKQIVAVRGDIPEDFILTNDYFVHATELVSSLKKVAPFEIYVGAYPEKHPEASSLEEDIAFLKEKVDSGATGIFTQFFFENESFLKFRDKISSYNIKIPLIPGIMPINSFKKIDNFAKKCGTKIPLHFYEIFNGKDEILKSEDILIKQCLDLIKEGVEGFHFYTLNTIDLTRKACQALGFVENKPRVDANHHVIY